MSDTQRVVEQVARRELELGVVGAVRRHRGVVFEPFFRDEVVLACPPGHPFANRTVTLDELKAEPLVLMQEGAGVRQVIDDELRAAGVRLRDLDVRLELGLQESARIAVMGGFGVTFISRSAIEADLAAGTLATARVEGLEPAREIALVRSTGRAETRVAQAFVEFARARLAMIVRWGLDALPDVCAEAGVQSPLLVASPRWDGLELPVVPHGRWSEVPSDRIDDGGRRGARGRRDRRRRRRQRDRSRQGALGRGRAAARLRPDDVLRRGVDDVLRHPGSRSGGCAAAARARGRPGSSTTPR